MLGIRRDYCDSQRKGTLPNYAIETYIITQPCYFKYLWDEKKNPWHCFYVYLFFFFFFLLNTKITLFIDAIYVVC